MTGVDDLVAWLHGQLDLDERVAKEADSADNQWWWDAPESPAEVHIRRWRPDRVLAEVTAKRLRLAEFQGDLRDDDTNETTRYLLQVEALPYADRPGYLDAWKPPAQ